MKLVIVTAVEQYQKQVRTLFRNANIEHYSSSDIDGFKSIPPVYLSASWVTDRSAGAESILFFSFTSPEKIDSLFTLIEEANEKMETNNPIRAIVVPVERFI